MVAPLVHAAPDFKRVYDENVAYVWRACRHLGVAASAVEDVLQEVFMVVHRRLGAFEGRSSLKTWLFGILLHVVRNHRRSLRRKSPHLFTEAPAIDELPSDAASGHDAIEEKEAVALLARLLDELDDARREVFVLAEIEQMSAPEIAALLGENVNTVYGRLRTARIEFDAVVRRHQARESRRGKERGR
jgi:RNA polymerase sigma-70 factor (ECF subfamily)